MRDMGVPLKPIGCRSEEIFQFDFSDVSGANRFSTAE